MYFVEQIVSYAQGWISAVQGMKKGISRVLAGYEKLGGGGSCECRRRGKHLGVWGDVISAFPWPLPPPATALK